MHWVRNILLAVLSAAALTAGAALPFRGPFRGGTLAFYYAHKGGPLKLSVELYGRNGAAVTRIFNADEKLMLWDYRPVNADPEVLTYDFGYSAAPGVYQIRVSGNNVEVNPRSDPVLRFGVSFMGGVMRSAFAEQFKEVYFLVPPEVRQITVDSPGMKPVLKAPGGTAFRGGKMQGKSISPGVWSANLTMDPTPWKVWFRIPEFSPIFCPDSDTVSDIGLSREAAADGRTFAHKFQLEVYERVKALRQEDLHLPPQDLAKFLPQMQTDPPSRFLVGGEGILTCFNESLRRPDNGLGTNNPALEAFVFCLGKPYNPWYRNPVLEKRILLSNFTELLKLNENDSVSGSADMATHLDRALAFATAVPLLSDRQAGELWTAGVRRAADRFSLYRSSRESLSARWPIIYQCIYIGTGEKGYRRLALDFIKSLALPENSKFVRTGYQQEAYGPDSESQSVGLSHQALFYRMTGNADALRGYSIVCDFMNHTAAPEPDGTVYGSGNFSHLSMKTWPECAPRAGLRLMRDSVPGAAVFPSPPEDFTPIDTLVALPPRKNARPTSADSPFFNGYIYHLKTTAPAPFPALAGKDFVRDFNGEFAAAKRGSCYLFVYLGRNNWSKADWGKYAFEHFAKLRPLVPENKKIPAKWTVTHGISVLWFKKYGSFLLGENWNGNTAHILRADLKNGRCAYPDYWNAESRAGNGFYVLKSKLYPLRDVEFERDIQMIDNGVRVRMRADFKRKVSVEALYDQIPFLRNKTNLQIEFMRDGDWSADPGISSAVRFNGNVTIRFSEPLPVSFGPDTEFGGQTMGSLRLGLGKEFEKDSFKDISYDITGE